MIQSRPDLIVGYNKFLRVDFLISFLCNKIHSIGIFGKIQADFSLIHLCFIDYCSNRIADRDRCSLCQIIEVDKQSKFMDLQKHIKAFDEKEFPLELLLD